VPCFFMKRLIYYPPGTYGTFVNWLCNTSTPVSKDDLPFADFGNSHKYYEENKYAALFTPQDRNILLKSSRDFGVLRCCWPLNVGVKLINTKQDPEFYYQTCKQDLQSIIPDCDKILVLFAGDQSKVWWYQNFCEKVILTPSMINKTLINKVSAKDNPWLMTIDPVLRARHHLDLQKAQPGLAELFSQYNKSTAVDFDPWQLRTAMVQDLNSQTSNAFQWQQLEQEFDTIKFVNIDQLRDNFQLTVIEILDFFEIEKRIVNDLTFIEHEWLQRQEHRFKDQVVNDIVHAVANNQELDWTDQINFFDEVYIQKLLNDRGISMVDCDSWPTTTHEFWKIIK
jgi:hypothetical protein